MARPEVVEKLIKLGFAVAVQSGAGAGANFGDGDYRAAGLAAIGTAAGLSAIVRANDTRAEVADQVKSLDGEFVEVDYDEEGSGGGYARGISEGFRQTQRAMYAQQAKDADIVITTALIPDKLAPKLITAEMVQSMRRGSVIVDMAAEQGGNCELTVPGEAVVRHGVTVVGYTDFTSRLALYASNLLRAIEELCKTKDGTINVDFDGDAIRGLTVIKEGNITWPQPIKQPAAAAPKGHGLGALAFLRVGQFAPAAFLSHFTAFVLACCEIFGVLKSCTLRSGTR